MSQSNYLIDNYKTAKGKNSLYHVLVVKITSPNQVLTKNRNSIHAILKSTGLDKSVGLYFYRFANLKGRYFTKIGEVSRRKGISERKKRGWLAPESYSDTYKKGKKIFDDIRKASTDDPMYFVFYAFDVTKSFPKIDEIRAFHEHRLHFGAETRNIERTNRFHELGSELAWHPSAFHEVLSLTLPSGKSYP